MIPLPNPPAGITKALGNASILAGLAVSLLTSKGSLPWVMTVENSDEEIKGQYTAQDLTENVGGVWVKASTLGRELPVLQFIAGQDHSVTFRTRLFSLYQKEMFGLGEGHDIVPLHNKIKALARVDKSLGRPPICVFSLGDDFSMQCVVESVGGIRYDEFTQGGTMRGAEFNISISEYEPFQVEEVGDEEPGDSLNHKIKVGETFEKIADDVYGVPALGVYLAQKHPAARWPQPGQNIRVPDKTKAVRNVAKPASIPLSADGMKDILVDLASQRGA